MFTLALKLLCIHVAVSTNPSNIEGSGSPSFQRLEGDSIPFILPWLLEETDRPTYSDAANSNTQGSDEVNSNFQKYGKFLDINYGQGIYVDPDIKCRHVVKTRHWRQHRKCKTTRHRNRQRVENVKSNLKNRKQNIGKTSFPENKTRQHIFRIRLQKTWNSRTRAKHRNRQKSESFQRSDTKHNVVTTPFPGNKNRLQILQERINESHVRALFADQHPTNWKLSMLDHRIWIGIGLGSVVSIITVLFGLLVYNYLYRKRKRNFCVDLNNLSLCSVEKIKAKDPVYVRLSQLHNTRTQKQGANYIVSVMDQSNNFSICSESSSSEEEVFNISDLKRVKSPQKSVSKISMTSTPVKATSANFKQTSRPTDGAATTRNCPGPTTPSASPIINMSNSGEE